MRLAVAIFCGVLLLVLASWLLAVQRKAILFTELYQKSFSPKPHVVIEFSDSTTYSYFSGVDSLELISQGNWHVSSDLFGTYLSLDEKSPMRFTDFSSKGIIFSSGEFDPTFIRFHGNLKEITEQRWLTARENL